MWDHKNHYNGFWPYNNDFRDFNSAIGLDRLLDFKNILQIQRKSSIIWIWSFLYLTYSQRFYLSFAHININVVRNYLFTTRTRLLKKWKISLLHIIWQGQILSKKSYCAEGFPKSFLWRHQNIILYQKKPR